MVIINILKTTIRWGLVSVFVALNLLVAAPAESVEWDNSWCFVEEQWVECCVVCDVGDCFCDIW